MNYEVFITINEIIHFILKKTRHCREEFFYLRLPIQLLAMCFILRYCIILYNTTIYGKRRNFCRPNTCRQRVMFSIKRGDSVRLGCTRVAVDTPGNGGRVGGERVKKKNDEGDKGHVSPTRQIPWVRTLRGSRRRMLQGKICAASQTVSLPLLHAATAEKIERINIGVTGKSPVYPYLGCAGKFGFHNPIIGRLKSPVKFHCAWAPVENCGRKHTHTHA